MLLVVLQPVDAHGYLRCGVVLKYRVTQVSIINVQYSIDDKASAASVTTQFNERIRRVGRCVLAYELASSPCLSNFFGGLGCSGFVW